MRTIGSVRDDYAEREKTSEELKENAAELGIEFKAVNDNALVTSAEIDEAMHDVRNKFDVDVTGVEVTDDLDAGTAGQYDLRTKKPVVASYLVDDPEQVKDLGPVAAHEEAGHKKNDELSDGTRVAETSKDEGTVQLMVDAEFGDSDIYVPYKEEVKDMARDTGVKVKKIIKLHNQGKNEEYNQVIAAQKADMTFQEYQKRMAANDDDEYEEAA